MKCSFWCERDIRGTNGTKREKYGVNAAIENYVCLLPLYDWLWGDYRKFIDEIIQYSEHLHDSSKSVHWWNQWWKTVSSYIVMKSSKDYANPTVLRWAVFPPRDTHIFHTNQHLREKRRFCVWMARRTLRCVQMAGEADEGRATETNRQEECSLLSLCSNNTKQFPLTFPDM